MPPPMYNFRLMDWGEFRAELTTRVMDIAAPGPIMTEAVFHNAVSELTGVVQDTIHTTVQLLLPLLFSKRWWNKNLKKLKKEKNKLSSLSYRYRTAPSHSSHKEHRRVWNLYCEEITNTKQEHWAAFLEDMMYGH